MGVFFFISLGGVDHISLEFPCRSQDFLWNLGGFVSIHLKNMRKSNWESLVSG